MQASGFYRVLLGFGFFFVFYLKSLTWILAEKSVRQSVCVFTCCLEHRMSKNLQSCMVKYFNLKNLTVIKFFVTVGTGNQIGLTLGGFWVWVFSRFYVDLQVMKERKGMPFYETCVSSAVCWWPILSLCVDICDDVTWHTNDDSASNPGLFARLPSAGEM